MSESLKGLSYPGAASVVGTIANPNDALALAKLAGVLAVTGELERALGVAERAEAVALTIAEAERRARALVGLVKAWVAVGDLQRAMEVAKRAEVVAGTVDDGDDYLMAQAQLTLLKAWVAVGELERAEHAAGMIDDPVHASQAQVTLVEAWAAAGELVRAERMASTIEDPVELSGALVRLVEGLVAAGEVEHAIRVAGRAESVASTIEDPVELSGALVRLVEGLVAAGEVEHAIRVADRAEVVTQSISDAANPPGPLMRALARAGWTTVGLVRERKAKDLVGAWVAAGELHRAESTAKSIEGPDEATSALALVANEALRVKAFDVARRCIARMWSTGAWAAPLNALAAADLDALRALADEVLLPTDAADRSRPHRG